MNRWLMRSMTELSSRKFVSRATGRLAKSSLSRRFIPRFAKLYRIPVEEAEKSLQDYASLNDFFTRRLKPGARPIDKTDRALVSPVDALITACGVIRDGMLLQVKGQDYTLEELLNGSPRTGHYEQGYFWVLYLSPTDYHRIHSPCSGTIVESEHIPGRVYPVNEFGLTCMRRVLSRNERLITYLSHEEGEVAVVKVGALNVSSIQYVQPLPKKLESGQELAYFEFGSTVVLLTENGTCCDCEGVKIGDRVKMGQKLGILNTAVKK
ncbi:archaetidylserine decarboxylase [Cohnella thailandensis]|uniref:Phosphatidylserine decarboxylase proenzyme n=1 Tax=Cohnella thailandensis TaxID=557557 RepID=A0A841SN51_9BACL|nr:archaetidylserine decarboxylase [Cohnella thailandensis]MBB6632602.1 phosphatidylserine decarboxylase [Cohnella thailandensis]MBP1975711.1 phosphatidylserine decarboxylase [Cohnella thailandensis]